MSHFLSNLNQTTINKKMMRGSIVDEGGGRSWRWEMVEGDREEIREEEWGGRENGNGQARVRYNIEGRRQESKIR